MKLLLFCVLILAVQMQIHADPECWVIEATSMVYTISSPKGVWHSVQEKYFVVDYFKWDRKLSKAKRFVWKKDATAWLAEWKYKPTPNPIDVENLGMHEFRIIPASCRP